MSYTIKVEKDGDGYLAEVVGFDYLYARGTSPEDAKQELYYVIDMMREQHLEQAEQELSIKTFLFQALPSSYAL